MRDYCKGERGSHSSKSKESRVRKEGGEGREGRSEEKGEERVGHISEYKTHDYDFTQRCHKVMKSNRTGQPGG